MRLLADVASQAKTPLYHEFSSVDRQMAVLPGR